MRRNTTSKVTDKVKRSRTFLAVVEEVMVRRKVFMLATLLAMLVLASGVALAVTLEGTAGNDRIYGTTQNDKIYGYEGNDRLFGSRRSVERSRNDLIDGGLGNDAISGRRGSDRIKGGLGNDKLADGPSEDRLKDKIYGGPGDDYIISESDPRATDIVACGTGVDKAVVDRADVFRDREDCEEVLTEPTGLDSRPRFR